MSPAAVSRGLQRQGLPAPVARPRPPLAPAGCSADWIYIELDGDKGLDPVAPLAVKRGEGDSIAL